jgi:hypothetical protein
MDHVYAALIIAGIFYVLFHHRHYRRNRREGFGVFYSLRGPFHTSIRVTKRL